jgi:sugar phosphate isomerase/epimerase
MQLQKMTYSSGRILEKNNAMIYISTACVKHNTIKGSVLELAQHGYKNIELTGGTRYYDSYENDLLELKDKYNLNYLLHNYFPPPEKHFILNIASLNDDLYQKSIEHCLRAIALCKLLGSKKFAIHAGFLIDFTPEEAGKKITLRKVNNRKEAIERFTRAWGIIAEAAGNDVMLYIENNVYSQTNYKTYEGKNPFLLTDYDGYLELERKINFTVLLDLAHLKVSCHTLNLNFLSQSSQLMQETDYFHISGNDGLHDENYGITHDIDIIRFLENCDLFGKTFTLEVYNGLDNVRSSFEIIQNLMDTNLKNH